MPSVQETATATVKPSSLLRAEILASFGAIGVLLYVALRFPFAIFYGKLGTTPEEVGLGYVQLLAQQSALVAVVAGLAVMFSTVSAMFVFAIPMMFESDSKDSQRLVHPDRQGFKNPEQIALFTDAEFAHELQSIRKFHTYTPRYLLFLDGALAVVSRLRELSRKEELSLAEKRERRRISRRWPWPATRAGFRTLARGSLRYLTWSFVAWSLFIMVGYLPLMAAISADVALSRCREIVIPYGFDPGRPVELVDATTSVPRFPERELLLLGGDSSKYVLFDCKSDSALRVPTSNYVVINR